MDILDYLKKRQSELEYISHPMADRDESYKYLYCFGLGVMAVGNMKAITEIQTYFDTVLDSIYISQKSRNQIIVDINNYFEFRIAEFFKCVKTKEEQYCFMADIYKMYRLSLWSQEYCHGILNNYLKVFRFSDAECDFFEKFNEAAQANNLAQAIECYMQFKKEGYDIGYQILVYFFPEFRVEESYDDLTIEAGRTVIFDKPVVVNGDINIERGGSLLIHGAYLRMNGCISTRGGRVQIRNARVRIEGCTGKYWLNLEKTAVVHIESSYIDCGMLCGLLRQESGRLIVSESEIRRTKDARAISFGGSSFILDNSGFYNNRAGSLELFGAAMAAISRCSFNDNTAEYGGAVQSESIGNVKIENCGFNRCEAKYLGSAVYFKYEKFGQHVRNCLCDGRVPEKDQIFNVYDDDLELKIR